MLTINLSLVTSANESITVISSVSSGLTKSREAVWLACQLFQSPECHSDHGPLLLSTMAGMFFWELYPTEIHH